MKYIKEIEYSTYKLDKNLKIIEIDDMFESITGYNKDDIVELNLYQTDLIPEEERREYLNLVLNALHKKEAYIEHRIQKKNGSIIFVFCMGIIKEDNTSIIRITKMDNSLANRYLKQNLKEDYKIKIKSIKKVAETDNLTGLLRRMPFELNVNRYLGRKLDIAFMLIDIDSFKSINDTYGHDIGDLILKKVSKILEKCVSENDLICRLGGDEFAICITDLKNKSESKKIAEEMRKLVNEIRLESFPEFKTSISIGIKNIIKPKEKLTFQEAYKLADKALYNSKYNGKNTIKISK